jgi:hypothetical protein
MDPFTFAKQISSQREREPELDSWAHQYLENSAVQTLHAARYVEHGPQNILQDYKTVLKTTLERLPAEVDLKVSQDLFETLIRIAGSEMQELLKSKIHTAVGCR